MASRKSSSELKNLIKERKKSIDEKETSIIKNDCKKIKKKKSMNDSPKKYKIGYDLEEKETMEKNRKKDNKIINKTKKKQKETLKLTIKGLSNANLSAEDIYKIISDISGKNPISVKIFEEKETIGIAEFENKEDVLEVIDLLNNIEIDGVILNIERNSNNEYFTSAHLIDECYDCKSYLYEKHRGRGEYLKSLFERDDVSKDEIDNLIDIDSAENVNIILDTTTFSDKMFDEKKKEKQKIIYGSDDKNDDMIPKDNKNSNLERSNLSKESKIKSKNRRNDELTKIEITDSIKKNSKINEENIDFEIDLNDRRFDKLYSSEKYRLDPSHSLFKKYKSNKKILDEVRTRDNFKE
ncbi:ESF1 like protein [Dictyocoela muelleri]|nr:ESF1 like protein [Dictyocoela muelleri]